MLRVGDQIRLTAEEKRTVDLFCDGAHLPAPTTVQELEKILLDAKAYYEQENKFDDNPEAKLLAVMAEDFYHRLIGLPCVADEMKARRAFSGIK